jgi:membrane-bound lytic murein transglycosylase D
MIYNNFKQIDTKDMTIKKILILYLFLATTTLFAQNIDYAALNQLPVTKLSVLDSIKSTFVKHNQLSTIDSLWMKELSNEELSEIQFDAIENFNPDTPVDFEFSTTLFKERLKKLDDKSPFNIEYNIGLENIVKGFLKNRKKAHERLLAISKYYFPMFEDALAKYNIPIEVKYLAIVESALNPKAKSRVGATGLWQFMYGTGLNYNLDVNSYIDERSDPLKATEAACKYLSGMYNIFHDWDLVLASYNCGPGNVTKAIRRSGGKQNYWNIRKNLPQETAGYLPLFLATMYVFEYHKEHGIADLKAPVNYFATDTIRVKNQLSFVQISKLLDIPIAELAFLNPSYKLNVIPVIENKNNYLRLPLDKIAVFTSNEDKIYYYANYESSLREKPTVVDPNRARNITRFKFYKVRKGDNLSEIADRYNVSVSDLKHWNHLRKNKVPKGRNLKIQFIEKVQSEAIVDIAPTENTAISEDSLVKKETNPNISSNEYVYKEEKVITFKEVLKKYKVKKGDCLGDVANRYDVSIEDVKKWNKLNKSSLSKGKVLKILKKESIVKTIRKKILKTVEDKNESVVEKSDDNKINTESETPDDQKVIVHTVLETDKILNICKQYEITLKQLKIWNSLKDNKLISGEKLVVFMPQNLDDETDKNIVKISKQERLHLVRKGDTIFSISKKYRVSVNDIKKWNGIKSGKLKPGMKLKIRV